MHAVLSRQNPLGAAKGGKKIIGFPEHITSCLLSLEPAGPSFAASAGWGLVHLTRVHADECYVQVS